MRSLRAEGPGAAGRMHRHIWHIGAYRRARNRGLMVQPSLEGSKGGISMTNEFIVSTAEILLVDEASFVSDGGESLHFGALEGHQVHLHAVGSRVAICRLARRIIDHSTATG